MIVQTKKINLLNNISINNSILYNSFNFDNNYNTNKYFSEILVISNETNIKRIYEWLVWHLNIIKFDHIIFIDNNDTSYLKDICNKFNSIEYIHKPGILSQSEIYTEYVNKSNSIWVLPIDDDEYLYISDKFNNNINNYLSYLQSTQPMYKYSINWHMMFNNNIIENDVDSFINNFKYTSFELNGSSFNDSLLLLKTIVNTKIKHLYINDINQQIKLNYDNINGSYCSDKNETSVILGSVHNPISKYNNSFAHSYNPETNQFIIGLVASPKLKFDINTDCFIAHYKYTTLARWKTKINRFKFVDVFNKEFLLNNYKYDTYKNAYNYLKDKLLIQDNLYTLYNKY